MQALIITVIINIFVSVLLGIGVTLLLLPEPLSFWQTPALRTITLLAGSYSLIITVFFFFIRRWKGPIKNGEGLFFSLILGLSSLPILGVLGPYLSPQQLSTTLQLLIIAMIQILGCSISTIVWLKAYKNLFR